MLSMKDIVRARKENKRILVQKGSPSGHALSQLTIEDGTLYHFGFMAMNAKELCKYPPENWDEVPLTIELLNVPIELVDTVPNGEYELV